MQIRTPIIAGIDEAGRGPLAGPVVAGAVILNPVYPIIGLADSKQLTEKEREFLFEEIKSKSLAWSVGCASVEEIDRINILQATLLAMQRAVEGLTVKPTVAHVDGNKAPKLFCEVKTFIKGDQTEIEISAASIVAKVTRDREMKLLHEKFPHYNFAKHKGYSTKEHLLALEKFGPCIIHRKTFDPVKNLLVI